MSILEACPTPTESSTRAEVAQATQLCPVSFGPGAGSLPAVHGVSGHDAAGRYEPVREQLPGEEGHGTGAEAGDTARKCESGPTGRAGAGALPTRLVTACPSRPSPPTLVQATVPQEERHDVTALYHRMEITELQDKFHLKVRLGTPVVPGVGGRRPSRGHTLALAHPIFPATLI